MRSRTPLFFMLLFLAGAFVLPHVAYAKIPFFGPIIPATHNVCPAAWGMIITVVNNLLEFAITIAVVFIAPIMIAYAGFLLVTNAGNPGQISKAKGLLTNTIIGIVIALAAWMIVNAIMVGLSGNGVGYWTQLITSGGASACLPQSASLGQTSTGLGLTGVSASGGTVYNGATALCGSGNTACSPAALQAAGLSSNQANTMSCIAVTESSGNPNTPPYNTTHPGSDSTACGTFQITRTTWNGTATGACSDFASSCMNAQCNLQVAATLVKQSGYSSWTCKNCNAKAQVCIQKYGG